MSDPIGDFMRGREARITAAVRKLLDDEFPEQAAATEDMRYHERLAERIVQTMKEKP